MNLIFAGTPDFADKCLQALLTSKHNVQLILTQPDRRKGRGQKFTPSAVKARAVTAKIPLLQSTKLDEAAYQQIQTYPCDLMIVVAYGLIIPENFLRFPKHGCINVHASLLPKWRGAAPIQRALLAGDTHTGITLMQMDAGLDTGDLLLQQALEISPQDTSTSLHDRLAQLGARLLLEGLMRLEQGSLGHTPQESTQASYANKLNKSEGQLNWSLPAKVLERQIRAFHPWPGCFTFLNDTRIKVLSAEISEQTSSQAPGTLLDANDTGLYVQTQTNTLCLKILQWPGQRALPVCEILKSKAQTLSVGIRFTVK